MPRRIIDELKLFSILALTLSISGCIGTGGITPQGQALPANTLATDAAINQAAKDAHWPAAQWWRAYADPQLDQWVATALQGNPSMAVAAARLRQARALAGIAESAEAPQVNARSSLDRHNWPADQFYGPGELSGATTWDSNATLGLSYALDLWGRESNASERAVDLAHMSAAELRHAQLELENNVVRVYIQLALHFAERDIAQATLAQQQQILELAQRRLKGGIGTHFEVSQAETPLPETHRQLDALDEQIALSRNQLAALAGKGPGAGSQLKRPALSLAAPLKLPSVLPAELLGQRPDVVASRWNVAAQARGIDVAHAGFYPNVDLVGSLGYMATGGGMLEFLTGKKMAYSVGPAISLPIFDGGRLRGQLGEAAAGYDLAVAHYNQTLLVGDTFQCVQQGLVVMGYDLAVAHYNQTLLDALKGISDQLIRRESMDKQQVFADEAQASARKTYDIALVAYQRGLTDYLNVLNAQTLLFRQQQTAQQVQAARLSAHAELVTALGGGLQAGSDAPAEQRLQAPPTPASLAVFDR